MAVSPIERDKSSWASRLEWYVRRLGVMSSKERVWRLGNLIRMTRRRYQFRHPLGPEASAAILCSDLLKVTPRFPQDAERWTLPTTSKPHQSNSHLERLGEGKWLIFGDAVTIEPPDAGQWQQDPLSGEAWPQKFGPSVKLVSRGVPGEYRFTWELNRLGFCYLLVAPESPWSLDEGLARCEQLVSSWLEGNPVYWGVNWSSAMEAAIRILHLCWSLVAIYQQDRSEGERLLQAWWPLLCAHAGFTMDRISLYSSANNHLIMELAALLTISAFASTLPPRWKQLVKAWEEELSRQLDRQFDDQGVNREHSSDYQRFVMQALELLDASGIIHSPPLQDKVQRVLRLGHAFLSRLGPDGGSFAFGDSDGGILFAGWSWRQADSGLIEDEGPVVDISGYLMGQAGDWEVFLDAADDGLPPMYGHAHSDLLSVQIRFDERTLVGDPGTYVYATDVPLRYHLRSRGAHSVFGPTDWEPFRLYGSFLLEPAQGIRRSLVACEEGWRWLWAQHDYHPHLVLERAVLCHPTVGCLVFDLAVNKIDGGEDDITTSWASRFRLAEGWQVKDREDVGWYLVNSYVNQDVVVQFSAPIPLDRESLLMPFSPAFTRLTRLPALNVTAHGSAPIMLVASFTQPGSCPEISWEDQTCRVETPEFLVDATLRLDSLSVRCQSKTDADHVVSFSGSGVEDVRGG